MRRAGGGSKSRWPAMLVVRGAILAEWSNSGAGSGLLGKIETGGDKKRKFSKGRERGVNEKEMEELLDLGE